jgi:preprotein translocase SecE subunit
VAKTRAQRKAEKRAREEKQKRGQPVGGSSDGSSAEARAQHDTQVPISGDVAEFEAAIETQQNIPDDGAPISMPGIPGITGETPQVEAPAPSRADEPAAPKKPSRRELRRQKTETDALEPPAPTKPSRRELRRQKKEEEEKAKRQAESEARLSAKKGEPAQERRRGGVIGFLASCWAELKRVQWPDRDTLVQASAVTVVFVAVMAAYLGALDALFDFLVKRII